MKNVSTINLSIRSKATMSIITAFTLILTILAYSLLGVGSSYLTKYDQSLLMANNPGISYVTYSPNQEQAEEISKIEGVNNVTTMRMIERKNLGFTGDTITFFAIENLIEKNSLKNTIFNNVLIGDDFIEEGEIYFDQILFDKSNLNLGDEITISFGSTVKTYLLGGVVSPVRDILTLNNKGVAIVNYNEDIDNGLSSATKITCLTISIEKNETDLSGLLSYLESYKPLGNIQSFEQFDEDYRNMHNQGAYTDEEYKQIIANAYEKYYNETYSSLTTGQYSDKATFFIDLINSYELKSIKENGDNFAIIFAVIFTVSGLIQLLGLSLPNIVNDMKNTLLEGFNKNKLQKYILFAYDLPYLVINLSGLIIFIIAKIIGSFSVSSLLYFVSIIVLILYIILSNFRNRFLLKNK